ncbi:MAG: Alpha/beta hydrolase [Patescibacteria group bacterium]|nr:Alpha/beta hydrolase [Patescibacteria group bacterium]
MKFMVLRVIASLAILLGLFWVSPFGVLADDTILPEIPLIELEAIPEVFEAVVEPVVTGLENLAEDIGELLVVAETTLLSETDTEEEVEEEPELIWECEMQLDGEGNEVERCGLGYYRTLCGFNAGVEECITFFEFYEEEGPDPLIQSVEDLEAREFLTLSLSWNGTPLLEDEDSFPLGSPGTLGWSYVNDEPDDSDLPHTYTGTYQEMFDASTLVLQIYKGEIGSASLVYSEEISHDSTSGELPFMFAEDDTYHVILASTFPLELDVPGYECGGELCPLFLARVESLVWFMENARTYYDVDEVDESIYFEEHGVTYNRMGTYLPLSFGMVAMSTEDAPAGISNVLFLPGIKGSRLYDGSGNKLWEPFGNQDLGQLFLDANGRSARNDIHAKEGDILSRVFGNNFYASFVNQMDALKADGTLTDWRAVAYDWRLSLDDIVTRGAAHGELIYFHEESETPYIEKTLKELAASSPTGKVSIIAHSNGGLVTKKLMQRLEANGEAALVDQIIFVGVPQSGAPQAMAGLLYGYGEALPADRCAESLIGWLCSILSSRDAARELAENSPMAYHLLPSQAYFNQVQDANHPVATFTALTTYIEERNRYGASIDSSEELYDFLAARDGGRTKPAVNDTGSANVLNQDFLNYGKASHENLDSWVPPAGVQVHQIAGWGMNTVSGVEFYEQKKLFGGFKEMYRPMFVVDGDGVVPIPSALLMSAGLDNVENYWIDLANAGFGDAPNINHSNLYELDEVRILIRDLLLKSEFELPEFVFDSQPQSTEGNRLLFFLHSPLTLEIYDEDGNHVGESADGTFDQEIHDVEYGEFGDVKYIVAPAAKYNVVMKGETSGVFSLDVQAVSNSEVTSSFTLADVPSTENTIATISVSGDLTQSGSLRVDENGDGIIDLEFTPKINEVAVFEPAVSIEVAEDVETSTSRSARTRRRTAVLNTAPPAVIQKVIPVAPKTVAKPLTLAIQTEEESVTKNIVAVEVHSLDGIERTPTQTQTASAYDAAGTDLMNWLSGVLYNFWDNLMTTVANLLPNK